MSSTLPADARAVAAPFEPFSAAPTSRVACRNCGAALTGRHCADCGQRHVEDLEPTLGELAADATSELLNFDGKIFETLRLLVLRPGELTAEHLRGRRVRYVAPLKLYLTVSLVYFLLLAALPSPQLIAPVAEVKGGSALATGIVPGDSAVLRRKQSMANLERLGEGKRGPLRVLLLGTARLSTDPVTTQAVLTDALPKLIFAMMPIFAFVLYRRYRANGRRYVTHLYFTLHFFAFWMVLSVPGHLLAMPRLGIGSTAVVWASLAVLGAYLTLALRRVHGGSLGHAAGRVLVVGLEFMVAFFALLTVTLIVLLGIR